MTSTVAVNSITSYNSENIATESKMLTVGARFPAKLRELQDDLETNLVPRLIQI